MSDHQVTRRTALAAGAAGLGTLSLAACGASAGSNPGAGAGQPAGSAERSTKTGQRLTRLDAVKVGEAVSAKLADGSPVLVARPSSTSAACFSAICTHLGCTVKPAGTQLHCPCHGSVYDAVTGAVVHGPAPRALSPVAVEVIDGEVVTG